MSQLVRTQQNPTTQKDPWTTQTTLPHPSGNISYGLSILNPLSTMYFQQEASLGQTITGLSAAQRFQVFNKENQLIMTVRENPRDTAHRICCAANRGFVLHICDLQNHEIIRITREFNCCGGACTWCVGTDYCKYEGIVESPPGVIIGTVRQVGSFYRTHLNLNDAKGRERLHIIGPCCICQGMFCCCCENKFKLMRSDHSTEIGAVFKDYAGLVNQAVTGAEKYTLRFPVNMPPEDKALAIGALFLINFKHFGGNAENKGGLSGTSLLSCFC